MRWLKGGVAAQNLFVGRSLRETVKNHGDGNSRAHGADFSATDGRLALEEILPGNHADIVSGVPQQPTESGSGSV